MRSIDLSEEQALLKETADRFLRGRYDFHSRAASINATHGFDPKLWRTFADMGWLGLWLPESHGGGGGSMMDVALLMEAFGQALVVEPFIPTAILGRSILLDAANNEQRNRLLPAMAAGDLRLALAYAEPQSGYDPYDVRTTAVPLGESHRLNGCKSVVLGAPAADLLIVSARTKGDPKARHGLTLFLVDPASPGVRLRSYQTIDGGRAAEVVLHDVVVSSARQLGVRDQAADALDAALWAGALAVSNQAAGALEGAVDATIRHLNTREQFGQKLGSFQALRHRLADMFVLKEEAKALTRLAASLYESAPPDERNLAIAAAKSYVGEAGRKVCEEAVQLHGAMAITDEHVAGHFLKKLIAIDRMFGDTTAHLDHFMSASPSLARDEAVSARDIHHSSATAQRGETYGAAV